MVNNFEDNTIRTGDRIEAVDAEAINPSFAVRQLAECGQRLSSVLWAITDTAEPNRQFAKQLNEVRSIQENWERALARIQASSIYKDDWDYRDWDYARECVAEEHAYRDKLALPYPDEESDHE